MDYNKNYIVLINYAKRKDRKLIDNEIFDSLQKLSKKINVSRSSISYYIKNNKEIKGFHYRKLSS